MIYIPKENQLQFIQHISINIGYMEPEKPLLEENSIYELLVITPSNFLKHLIPLISHKNEHGIKTKLEQGDEIALFPPVSGG